MVPRDVWCESFRVGLGLDLSRFWVEVGTRAFVHRQWGTTVRLIGASEQLVERRFGGSNPRTSASLQAWADIRQHLATFYFLLNFWAN